MGKNGGMKSNGMPASLGLSLISGVEEVYEFSIEGYTGGAVSVDYYTFRVLVRSCDGKSLEVGAEARGNVVKVAFPALEEGEYEWSLVASDASGAEDVLVAGKLGVFWPDLREKESVVRTPNRRAVIRWADGHAVARWQRTDFTQMAVLAAQEAAEDAERALDGVRAETKVIQGFLAVFDGKVEGVAAIDPDTGNLVIGGVDLGVSVAGKSPYVDSDGHWRYWSDEVGAWLDGGSARGQKGIDGQTVRRIKVDSIADIPQEGDTCNGGFLYYVPNGDMFDIYAWLEPDGWVRVDMKNDIASSEVYGLMKYGTDEVLGDGAPVGQNAEGRATVQAADYDKAGVAKTGGKAGNPRALVKTDENGRLCIDAGSGLVQARVAPSGTSLSDAICRDGERLLVLDATTDEMGVVKLAGDIHSDGVVTTDLLPDIAEDMASGFAGKFAAKGEVYSKDEVYTREEADERYLAKVDNDKCVQGDGVKNLRVVTIADFATMERDAETIYIVMS